MAMDSLDEFLSLLEIFGYGNIVGDAEDLFAWIIFTNYPNKVISSKKLSLKSLTIEPQFSRKLCYIWVTETHFVVLG